MAEGQGTGASRYSSVAITLHWLIAGLILLNFALAWQFGSTKGLALFRLIQLHKSVGICVLLLSLARLGWRLFHRPPPLPASMNPLMKAAAHAVHWGLYGYMILAPLTGWLFVSVSPKSIPTRLFNAIPWPYFPVVHGLPLASRKQLEVVFGYSHGYLALLAYGLLILHLGAVAWHQLIKRDQTLGRMAPLRWLQSPLAPARRVD